MLTDIEEMNDSYLRDGCFLVLFHVNKIPPHLGLVSDSKYFSLTATESQINVDIDSIWRVIRSKSIETIFIKVDVLPMASQLAVIFGEYKKAVNKEFTCLQPIKDFFEYQCDWNVEDVNFIFDLIHKLKEKSMIVQNYHLNLDRHLKNGSFELLNYTLDDIYKRIMEIQHAS